MSISSISRILLIPKTTVRRRLLSFSKTITAPTITETDQVYEVDEMQTFIGSKHPSLITQVCSGYKLVSLARVVCWVMSVWLLVPVYREDKNYVIKNNEAAAAFVLLCYKLRKIILHFFIGDSQVNYFKDG